VLLYKNNAMDANKGLISG